MAKLKGIAYLRRKLDTKSERVELRYKHYEMKHVAKDLRISTPPQLIYMTETLGWCAKAVDSLADRLVFREFRDDNFDLTSIFQMNNPDVLFDSAVLSALISSCCFIYISPDDDGYPRLQVIDGRSATGEMDPITGLLTEGYAILQRDSETDRPVMEAYFEPHRTTYLDHGKVYMVLNHQVPYPLLVPIIFRPDEKRPFGHSRISRACMSIADAAVRTVKRSEISAEFYSFPQKYVSGISPDTEIVDKWKAAMSAMMYFEKDDAGDHPVVGQFSQGSMQPHIDQFRMFAAQFAGETGLTMDDLGFPTENPSSAEAIKAAHENLRLTARKAQRNFGTGFLNVGMLAACLRDQYAYQRRVFYETKPIWEPVFEPDMAAIGAIGDAVGKLNDAMPGYMSEEKLRDMTGV